MTAPQNLSPSLVVARQCYDKLELALVPIREAIQDMEQDWKPRTPAFWKRLKTNLAEVQRAVNACIAVASTASIAHRSCLHSVRGYGEEVGNRLASYKDTSDQKQLQQRKKVLQALRDIHKEGQETLTQGREWLDEGQYPSDVLTSNAAKPMVLRTIPVSSRGTQTANQASTRPMLRLVGNQATEEDSSDTVRSG